MRTDWSVNPPVLSGRGQVQNMLQHIYTIYCRWTCIYSFYIYIWNIKEISTNWNWFCVQRSDAMKILNENWCRENLSEWWQAPALLPLWTTPCLTSASLRPSLHTSMYFFLRTNPLKPSIYFTRLQLSHKQWVYTIYVYMYMYVCL